MAESIYSFAKFFSNNLSHYMVSYNVDSHFHCIYLYVLSFVNENGERYNAAITQTINGKKVHAINSPKVLIAT